MPNWKKVIVSGSDASLNSLYVTNAITASVFSGSYTGSLQGTASYSTTASYALNSAASTPFPYSGSAVITGSLTITGSNASPQLIVKSDNPYIYLDQNSQASPYGPGSIVFRDYNFATKAIGDQIGSILTSDSGNTSTGGGIIWTKATSSFSDSRANTKFTYNSAADAAIYISGSGNVGIRTTTPVFTFDVSGSGRYTNGLTVTGSLVATSFTGSLQGTASYATTASYALNTAPSIIAITGSTIYSTNPVAGPGLNTMNTIAIGEKAGQNSAGGNSSVFFGPSAGGYATNAQYSVFIGDSAGLLAGESKNSNFIGQNAGTNATASANSNFFGSSAGADALYANNSNFFGQLAGNNATNAQYSNFIGYYSGKNATDTSYSTLIGYKAGFTTTSSSIKENNIIIGTNISLPAGTKNSINIGGILFGTGSYSTITNASTSSYIGTTNGRIGINIISPNYTLDVSGSGNFTNGLIVSGTFTVTTGSTEFQVLPTGTKIGNAISDTHTVTGSLSVTGSLNVSGSVKFTNLDYSPQSYVVGIDVSTGQLYRQGTTSVTNATTVQINTPDANDVYVRPQELETSKHATINIFNYLNFS